MEILFLIAFVWFAIILGNLIREEEKQRDVVGMLEKEEIKEEEKGLPDDLDELKKMVRKYKEERRKEKEKREILNKRYKIITIVWGIVTIIVISSQMISPAIIHGSTDVIMGGKDIELISEKGGKWEIRLWNDGWANSRNIKLRVIFKDNIRIDYDNIYCNPTPDINKTEKKNEIEYIWNTLAVLENIYVYMPINSDYTLIGKTKPKLVEVRTKEEGLVYSYYGKEVV